MGFEEEVGIDTGDAYIDDDALERTVNGTRYSTKKASTQNRVGAKASDTAVSSESAVKVAQNLEQTKKNYENLANRTRGFVLDSTKCVLC